MLQHKFLQPKRAVNTVLTEESNEGYRKEAVNLFKKEKKNFKYDSVNVARKKKKDGPGKGGVPMKPALHESAIKQAGYFMDTPSARAIERLNSIQKLSALSAATYGNQILKKIEKERQQEGNRILNKDLAFI